MVRGRPARGLRTTARRSLTITKRRGSVKLVTTDGAKRPDTFPSIACHAIQWATISLETTSFRTKTEHQLIQPLIDTFKFAIDSEEVTGEWEEFTSRHNTDEGKDTQRTREWASSKATPKRYRHDWQGRHAFASVYCLTTAEAIPASPQLTASTTGVGSFDRKLQIENVGPCEIAGTRKVTKQVTYPADAENEGRPPEAAEDFGRPHRL